MQFSLNSSDKKNYEKAQTLQSKYEKDLTASLASQMLSFIKRRALECRNNIYSVIDISTASITVASVEESFSKLKLIKNYAKEQ